MTTEQRWERTGEVVTRTIGEETLLVPIHGELANLQRIFQVDAVGAFIWEQLQGQQSLDTITERVVAEFNVEANRAAADCREFVATLEGAGLVHQVVP